MPKKKTDAEREMMRRKPDGEAEIQKNKRAVETRVLWGLTAMQHTAQAPKHISTQISNQGRHLALVNEVWERNNTHVHFSDARLTYWAKNPQLSQTTVDRPTATWEVLLWQKQNSKEVVSQKAKSITWDANLS